MAPTPPTIERKQPLSLWEKVKIGVTSFVKSALDYIPRGVIMAAIGIGIVALTANLTGFGFLSHFADMSLGGFLTKVGIGTAIGTALVGSLGAYQGVKAHTQYREKEIETQELAIIRQRQREQMRQKQKDGGDRKGAVDLDIETPQGLPDIADKTLGIG